MKLRLALVALATLSSAAASAQVTVKDHRTKQPPPAPSFDATGWLSLGELTVNGKHDHDTLDVGAQAGRFSKLTFVVEDSDLEMHDIVVHFGNGESFSPTTKLVFAEGSRTGAIDLPGDQRIIKTIDFAYGNLPGSGKARVRVYGMAILDTTPAWDATGWTKLGTRKVNGRKDHDTIKVSKYEGRFDQVTFVVEGSALDVQKFTITFEDGEKWTPRLKQMFDEGSWSRAIDLPGSDRHIKKIDIKYKKLAKGARTTMTVFARDTQQGKDPNATGGGITVHDHREADFDSSGWTMLGEQSVDGARDHDEIDVPRAQSKIAKLTLVVLDSDLELAEIKVVYKGGKRASLATKAVFAEGSRTRAIDLPRGKKVKSIELWYGNLAGGGKARVQVWVK
jgi:hypothetical protein